MSSSASTFDLFRTRFEEDEKCFEDGIGPILPMYIGDVPTSAEPAQANDLVPLQMHACTSLKVLDEYLGDPANAHYKFRFMCEDTKTKTTHSVTHNKDRSISQRNSWSRLQITKPMLRRLFEHHNIETDFLEVPLSFFDRMTDEEQSLCVPWTMNEDATSIRMCASQA